MGLKTVFKVDFVRGQKRPRMASVKGHARVYKDPYDKVLEQMIAYKFLEAGGKLFHGACRISINCFSPAPKSKKEDDFLVKPDADNIAKLILDALNGVAYKDDAQVISLKVKKHKRTHDLDRAYTVICVENFNGLSAAQVAKEMKKKG